MCLQCDGYSFEEAMLALDLKIQVHGWALIQVDDDGPEGTMSWAYTVGLTEHYGHPELAMFVVRPAKRDQVIRLLVEGIVDTGRVIDDDVTDLGLELVPVHPNNLTGDWFGTWANHTGHLPPAGSFLQIVPPKDWFCSCHQNATPRLDRPGVVPFGNRAARRQRGRPSRGGPHRGP